MIKVVGIDPAITNCGIVVAEIDLQSLRVTVLDVELVETKKTELKTVRASSDALRRARMIYRRIEHHCKDASFAVSEVPSGSQSATAARMLGIATGILGCLSVPLIEVSPKEVKMSSVGSEHATKQQMILWGATVHPEVEWLRQKGQQDSKLLGKNEHIADALAAIYAGLDSEQGKSLTSTLRHIGRMSSPNIGGMMLNTAI